MALGAALAFLSCAGSGKTASAVAADTTAVDSVEVSSLPPILPDTAYPSVSAITPTTRVIDTTISAAINLTADMYAGAPGIMTFRGNAHRDADFHGSVKGTPSKITLEWTFATEMSRPSEKMGSWGGGSGWTGQPLYVEWPDSCVRRFRKSGLVTRAFKPAEIIVGSLAGKVYFIDYATGGVSRDAIDVGNPIKGTVSLDPTLNGFLYVGHGIPVTTPFGASVIDLFSGKVIDTYGRDPRAPRGWGAYDSSALRVGQFVFRPGENGVIYKYAVLPGEIRLVATMSYRGGSRLGIESSMSAYSNYGYTADNSGNIVCTNLNTMRPVWHYALGDDTDATPVLLIEENHPYLYVGSEIDKQGEGSARFAKIDGLNGKEVWRDEFAGRLAEVGGKHFDGGFYATALPGRGDCSDLIFTNVVRNLKGQNGEFVALDKATGKTRYCTPLKYYSWSSPVGFLNEKGEMFVVTGDCSGRLYLIKGTTGEIIFSAIFGSNFESSPAVVGNKIVVGSRGDKIYKFSID